MFTGVLGVPCRQRCHTGGCDCCPLQVEVLASRKTRQGSQAGIRDPSATQVEPDEFFHGLDMSQPSVADPGIGEGQSLELFESGNDCQIIVTNRGVVQVKRLQFG